MNYPKDSFKQVSHRLLFYFAVFMGCLLLPTKSNASHIVGGEMTYICLGNNQYEISLTIYRDCFSANPNAGFDDTVSIGIFDSNDDLVLSLGNGFSPGEF